jgi:hypothetical protein
MKQGIFLALFILCPSIAEAQSLHIKDLIALDQTPRSATDSFLRSKKFSVCESDQTGSIEGHEYRKYSPNCKEEFQEYVTDNYQSGHHITYVFYDNNFYKILLAELKNEGYYPDRKHSIASCKVTDYKSDDHHKLQLRVCKQEEGNKYHLSIPVTTKK